MSPRSPIDQLPLGIGLYTVPDAERLLAIPASSIRRWLGGYSYRRGTVVHQVPALWTPQLPANDDHIELGFRDLIELRFVHAFTKAGLGLKTIRHCLTHARAIVADERPFSTQRFRTDGRTIFFDLIETGDRVGSELSAADARVVRRELIDLKSRQYAFPDIIERSFKDLDLEDSAVSRWRPYKGRASIVIDPTRAFGAPIAAETGVPTATLADAVEAEGSERRVARLFNVPPAVVRDAVRFESTLVMRRGTGRDAA